MATGYELDTLIEWTNKFEDYNKFCYSPFSKAKKNGMATSLAKVICMSRMRWSMR